MQKRLKFRKIIAKAQNGEEDALLEVIHRFIPLVKKYSVAFYLIWRPI